MYYPDQRYASNLTIIRREAKLPEGALGTVRVNNGQRVDIRDVVANGVVPSRYLILDAQAFFKLRRPDKLEPLLQVEQGAVVEKDDVLAGKNPKRGKRLFSPVKGVVARIDGGRIILQEMPEVIDVEAGVQGRVVDTQPGRGVVIEATGAQAQGVWGNGRHVIATLRLEPDAGLETIEADSLEQRFTGSIVLTRRPLTAESFESIKQQNFAGVIAPSMQADLIDWAMAYEGALLLTEGFGNIRMGTPTFNLLQNHRENAVTLDAHTPSRYEPRPPEVIINVASRSDESPARPNAMLTLRNGMTVRVTRQPYLGLTGRVADLPQAPIHLDNGLRVTCAKIELISGETAYVPTADLEVLGR